MSITKIAEKYIQDHPYVRVCLQKGIINYSSLARLIGKEEGIDDFDALLIACRRYRSKLDESKEDALVIELLKKSKIEAKNKIASFVLDRNTPLAKIEALEKQIRKSNEQVRIIEGASSITLILPEEHEKEARVAFRTNIITSNLGLVEVTIKSPKEIESLPGVISLLYLSLAEHNINIIETLSCWTDTIFIIDEKDLAKAMQLLRF